LAAAALVQAHRMRMAHLVTTPYLALLPLPAAAVVAAVVLRQMD
jgi:hypothetical protein